MRVVIIFRMTATMMTLDFLSAAARRLWKASEAPAGFRSRLGPSHDSTLVTPHNAPFPTYKTARLHTNGHGLAADLSEMASRLVLAFADIPGETLAG